MAAATPTLPGVYPTYDAAPGTNVPPNVGEVVAVAIRHNWGPVGSPELYTDFGRWEEDFGSDVTQGRVTVYNAFNGEGVEGFGGAGGVLVSRIAGATAKAAAVTLNAPGGAGSLRVFGIYPGTRGNRLSASVAPIVNGFQTITILDGTTPVQSFTYATGVPPAMAGLAAQFTSGLADAEVVAESTTGLAAGTFPLVGGDDGVVLTGTDWINGTAPFNDVDFAFFAVDDLPWAQGIPAQSVRDAITSLQSWRADQESQGHRFTLVVGGALDELPADAIARATSLSDPGVITVGGPGFDDDVFGPLSTSQLASRYAGIRAQRGEGMSADMARLAGGTPRNLPTGARLLVADVESMVAAGVVVLTRDRYTVAPTRIAADVNTYQPNIGSGDPALLPAGMPKSVWGTPKFVLSMQQFANDAQAQLEQEMIGKVVVSDTTRSAAAGRVLAMAKDRERIGAFNPGTIVQPVPGKDTDNFIIVKVSLVFGRALAQLFIKSTVR